MCKVLMIAGIKESTRENALAFVRKMGEQMTTGNTDGLGYAAVTETGELFAERWLKNSEAFTTVVPKHIKGNQMAKMFDQFVKGTFKEYTTYTNYGKPDLNKAVAITLHTRMATSSKGMENTHPFILDDTSLIHNGVISNVSDFKLLTSTCDSEAILISYLKHNVRFDYNNIQKMANNLTGYYACGVFSKDANGKRFLDIFNGENENLNMCWINELDTWVISTSKWDIEAVCRQLNFTLGSSINDFMDGRFMRVDPITSELIAGGKFTPNARWGKPNTSRAFERNHYTPPITTIKSCPVVTNKKLTEEEERYLNLTTSIRKVSEQEQLELIRGWGYTA